MFLLSEDFHIGMLSLAGGEKEGKARARALPSLQKTTITNMADETTTDQSYWGK